MNRRSLLLGLGTVLAAPAIVRADSLMKLWVPPKPKLIVPDLVDEADLSGHLWTHDGKRVGWWVQRNRKVEFRWDDDKPTGHYTHGKHHSIDTFMRVTRVLEVKTFKPSLTAP